MDDDDETKALLKHEEDERGIVAGTHPDYEAVRKGSDGRVVTTREVQYRRLPLVIWMFEKLGLLNFKPLLSHKALILILTFLCYMSYHLSRKPTSVAKVVFCPECAHCNISNWTIDINETRPGWAPFNSKDGDTLLGTVDSSWLFAYAIAMFVSGQIADRVNLRYFLTIGMLGSGVSVALLGVTYYADIHMLWYFIVVQVFGGVMQSTGWPGTVAVISHWFGKDNRGLIMGVWNSHTSVGNILGTVIPGIWADCDQDEDPWGWSFFVPGFIIFSLGIVMFLMLVVDPKHVGLSSPRHNDDELEEATPPDQQSSINDDDEEVKKESRHEENKVFQGDPEITTVQASAMNEKATPLKPKSKSKAVNILRAFLIPGVIEFSLALFFNKLVSYTFLYWLPLYVKHALSYLTGPQSAWLSTLFDVGGIIGGILAGVVSDRLKSRAIVCVVMLILAIPSLFILQSLADKTFGWFIVMLIVCGVLVNGPYGMITTAVSSDLGTHKSLKNNQNAKATVTAIIDGTGSIGAAIGPLLIGWVTDKWNWMAAFYVLMGSCLLSAMLLSRLVFGDIKRIVLMVKSLIRKGQN